MTKLLSGRQLYMSQHIHNQVLHPHPVEAHDTRPMPDWDPCLMTCSPLLAPFDLDLLKYEMWEPVGLSIVSERIGPGDFIFKDLPVPFREGYLSLFPHFMAGCTSLYIQSKIHLASLRYAIFFPVWEVYVMIPGEWVHGPNCPIAPKFPGCVLNGNTLNCVGIANYTQYFHITVDYYPTFDEAWACKFSNYATSSNRYLEVRWVNSQTSVFTVFCNADGEYEIITDRYGLSS